MKELELKLREANQAYRLGSPIMEDYQYDKLVEDLRKMNPQSDFFKEGINTSMEEIDNVRKRKLPIQMRSLDKVKTLDELEGWLISKHQDLNDKLIITPKYDGLSILCKESTKEYYTSGDGFVGQDVTEHLSHCNILNQSLKEDRDDIYTIGELIISRKAWKDHFEGKIHIKSKREFKSPRNTVSGLMNTDDVSLISNYLTHCDYIPYTLISNKEKLDVSKLAMLKYIYSKEDSIKVPHEIKTIHEVDRDYLTELFKKWSQEYVIDGLVLDINNASCRIDLDYESNDNPEFARAYKDPLWSEKSDTVIEDIVLQVSKRGVITPVLKIKPVKLSGATISNVNGINARYIIDWHLYKGQTVTVLRSGEVIPKIVAVRGVEIPFREMFVNTKDYKKAYQKALIELSNLESESDAKVMDLNRSLIYCPSCGTCLSWNETRIDKVCVNPYCKDRVIQQASFFFENFEISDLGSKTIERLYESFNSETLSTPQELIKSILTMSIADLLKVEGFQIKSAQKLYRQFQKLEKKGYSYSKLMYSLGNFDDLGESTIQKVLDELEIHSYNNMVVLGDLLEKNPQFDELLKIEGISSITAAKLANNLKSTLQSIKSFNWNVVSYGEVFDEPINGPLTGYKFCFTQFRDKNLKASALKLGGEVTESMTKKNTHLVVLDKNKKTGKVKKAIDYGISLLTKEELIDLINKSKNEQR